MSRIALPLLASIITLIASPIMAAENTNYDKKSIASVSEAIDFCVDQVHKHKAEDTYEQKFYLNFDAYYNPATEKVYNNAIRNGDQPPLYIFHKCMTKVGYPLE